MSSARARLPTGALCVITEIYGGGGGGGGGQTVGPGDLFGGLGGAFGLVLLPR
ncbi:MAG: hypothetical protein KIS63_05715 [Caldilineales bacterium]|nr:hypothetical protein [Caldilineales bacterium]